MTKTTLLIPDLHHRWEQAEKIISNVKHDEVIFLGDFFDDFGDTPEMVKDTCEWLVDSVNKPNRIHLIGNHDQMYMYANRSFQCSGYVQWKYFVISDMVPRSTWDKLKWYHFLNNRWLMSHGGLHKFNVPASITKFKDDRKIFIKELSGYLDHEIQDALRNGNNNKGSWVFGIGQGRYGTHRVGGITWCDFDVEFYPVNGLNQIVGHTPQTHNEPKWAIMDSPQSKPYFRLNRKFDLKVKDLDDTNKSINLCLDVWKNTHWATWNGEKMEFGNYRELSGAII
jgi:hypothetical protein